MSDRDARLGRQKTMPRPPSGNIRVNFYIDPRVLAALRKLARVRGTTYSDLIRMATNAYVISEIQAMSKIPPVSRREEATAPAALKSGLTSKQRNAMVAPILGRAK